MSVTLILILLTCVVSFACFSNGDLFGKLAHYPYEEHNSNQKYRWLTSAFVHVDMFHLFINMFVLYNFGTVVEHFFKTIHGEAAGKIVFLFFYLALAVFANLPTFMKYKSDRSYRAVGASGAVAAVLFSFIVFRPLDMLELYFFIPIPAIIFGILYLWYENWAGKKQRDNIGHDAHFYGAVGGFIFTMLMDPKLITDFFYKLTNVFH